MLKFLLGDHNLDVVFVLFTKSTIILDVGQKGVPMIIHFAMLNVIKLYIECRIEMLISFTSLSISAAIFSMLDVRCFRVSESVSAHFV